MTQRGEDGRRHPRFCCSGNAEMRSLDSGLRASGKIKNLSLGGCQIQLGEPHGFREGDRVEMTFCVRQLPLRVQACIRQLRSGSTIGVAFTLLSERGKLQLLALIEELAENLRDQVDTLIQFQSSPTAVPSDRSCAEMEKDPPRPDGRPVPIDRGFR